VRRDRRAADRFDALHHLVEVRRAEDFGVAEGLVDRILAAQAIAEAGGVAHQLAHGGRRFRSASTGLPFLITGLPSAPYGEHFQRGQFGHVFGHWIIELPFALLVELASATPVTGFDIE